MRLEVIQEGATPEEIERAERAVYQFFVDAKVHPFTAAAAAFKQEGEQEPVDEQEAAHAELWREAPYIAAKACREGWENASETVELNLQYKPAEVGGTE